MSEKRSLIGRFLIWRIQNINDRYFIIFLSIFTGFMAGLAAIVLKTSVFYIHKLVSEQLLSVGEMWQLKDILYVFLPLMGILLTVLFIYYVLKDDVRHGIPRILFVISKKRGVMRRHKIFSSLIGGSLTAGFGGSVGLESPIISTGASIGSNLGRIIRLTYPKTILLIGCGTAGAMAGIFNTPIAGVIFSLEVLMLDLSMGSIIPLLMASVTGSITTKMFFNEQILIQFEQTEPFMPQDIVFYVFLGILSGLMAYYFNRINYWIEDVFSRQKNKFRRVLIGGVLLGVLVFLFPPLYGEGYDIIKILMRGEPELLLEGTLFYSINDLSYVIILFLLLIVVLKIVATMLTIESGGIGGIFAPSAVTGGVLGFSFAYSLNTYVSSGLLSYKNFTLVGMASVLGAVLHAPLTAIFLISEITDGYDLIIPLMMTAAIAYITIKIFDSHSIFTKRLASRGALITHQKDQTVLTLLDVKNVIDTDLKTINPYANLGELTKIIAKSKRNIYPVVDSENTFLGLVALDDVREDMFNPDKYHLSIEEYIIQPLEQVSTSDSMETVMETFKKTGYYNIPVIDNKKYIGFISRSNLFSAYRKILQEVSHEF